MNALTYATAQILRVLPRTRITRAVGRLADYAWPTPLGAAVVKAYCRAYDVDLAECEQASGFTSFDAFFTRALRSNSRAMPADPNILVCPADGRVDSMGPIDGRSFLVKGRPYRVDELLGDAVEARRYEGGAGCVVYLSPRDYHRVHSPVEGEVREVRSMPGDYYPVNAIGVRHVHNLFVRNRRVSIAVDTPGFGRVAIVMVAAIVVGRITVTGIEDRDVSFGLHSLPTPIRVARGDEIGIFRLGSTAVVLFEPGVVDRWLASEGPVRYGQPLATHKPARTNGSARGKRSERGTQ